MHHDYSACDQPLPSTSSFPCTPHSSFLPSPSLSYRSMLRNVPVQSKSWRRHFSDQSVKVPIWFSSLTGHGAITWGYTDQGRRNTFKTKGAKHTGRQDITFIFRSRVNCTIRKMASRCKSLTRNLNNRFC